jgi:hypothetical protein
MLRGAETDSQRARRTILAQGVLGAMALYAAISAFIVTPRFLTGTRPDERAAMAWAASNTPSDARFLIVSGDNWALDRPSEWFPVLAHRQSVATVQGYEWVEDGAFARRLSAYRLLQLCSGRDRACLTGWAWTNATQFDYVYLPKLTPNQAALVSDDRECCPALRASLRADASYQVVYDGDGATIFARR